MLPSAVPIVTLPAEAETAVEAVFVSVIELTVWNLSVVDTVPALPPTSVSVFAIPSIVVPITVKVLSLSLPADKNEIDEAP